MLRRCPLLRNEHFQALGLSHTATTKEIKHAFREQTKRHHPDVGGDPEQFKRICNAYSILTGKAHAQAVDSGGSGFYSDVRARNPNYAYYYGTSRTRDGESSSSSSASGRTGSEHGRHGAEWANHGGASANYSTRDFYRPYESAHGATGFTEEELRAALRATYLHRTWNALKKIFMILAVYWMAMSYRADRLEANERARQQGYDAAYWEIKAADKAHGHDSPLLPSYWERKQREMDEARIADEKRRKAMGLKNPFDVSSVPAGPTAVTYRGQPFTPAGLEATRRARRGEPVSPPIDLNGIDDISYELEDAE